ncbi:hypothetical protein [Sulfuricurvum sp.]|uniref:hypothetical protein n=1 Tax=Sulfuricurvum sp. TaxID=2025608 RepID=UPI002D2B47FA|nr:hypothetical protein [Sulfuricurvum sp.]HZF69244.1 hypothetical protein [Sulfuricurvum sp.]
MNFLKWVIDILFGWIPYIPQAIWHMWSLDRNGTVWYKIRAFSLLCLGTWVIIVGYFEYIDYMDFSVTYPKYEQLKLDEGLLSYKKYSKRDYDLTLTKKDGDTIHINHMYGGYSELNTWYMSEKGMEYDRSYPVAIRWFSLLSGTAWIAELEMNNKKVITFQKGKTIFDKVKSSGEIARLYGLWIPFFLLMAVIYFEAAALRKKGAR